MDVEPDLVRRQLMTRIDVGRPIQADPSSVALVLAGPAARELWPPRADRLIGAVAPQGPALSVTLDPPGRTGVGFTARVRVHGAARPHPSPPHPESAPHQGSAW